MKIIKSINNLNKFEKRLWFVSTIIVAASFIVSKGGDYLTLTASLIGVSALIFVAKGDVLGQVLTVIFSLVYSVISFGFAYYGEMITYLGMTAPIAFVSIITWMKNPYSESQVKIRILYKTHFIGLAIATALVTWGFYYILDFFNTANIFFSTVSVATSFLAATLMMMRSTYYAVFYGLNDIVLIILWLLASFENISYIPMVICFVMFLINDIYGFVNWSRMRRHQQIQFEKQGGKNVQRNEKKEAASA